MDDTVSPRKAAIVAQAFRFGALGGPHDVAGFVDLDAVRASVADLKASFPPFFTHAFACKAGSLVGVLRVVRAAGMACEVASPGELRQAQEAGFAASAIVYDSPAKTRAEIRTALDQGMVLNIDNFQELARVDEAVQRSSASGVVGIRVNPQVGVGAIAAMSTATLTSKFGIGLNDDGNRQRIVEAYRARPWLTCVHVHVGSQGCPLELIAAGVGKAVALAQEINATLRSRQVTTVDIGGGLPVNFTDDAVRPSFADYAAALRAAAPALFTGEFRVISEFGRSVLAKNGFIVARVEYTKTMGGKAIAITHAGAQVATRTVFMPDLWPIRVSALGPDGVAKTGPRVEQDVAGPCCFAGDIVAAGRALPQLEQDDHVLLHDTGAYYFSTQFVYNSLPRIAVWGVVGSGQEMGFALLRAEETLDEVVAASAPRPLRAPPASAA